MKATPYLPFADADAHNYGAANKFIEILIKTKLPASQPSHQSSGRNETQTRIFINHLSILHCIAFSVNIIQF